MDHVCLANSQDLEIRLFFLESVCFYVIVNTQLSWGVQEIAQKNLAEVRGEVPIFFACILIKSWHDTKENHCEHANDSNDSPQGFHFFASVHIH